MPNSHHERLIALTATLGTLLGAGAGTASAGTNGQQVNYYSHYSYAQCTTGTNQNGEDIQNCTQLRIGANPDQGYWWVGPVSITWYHPDNSHGTSTCDVPTSQDSDFFTCYEPS